MQALEYTLFFCLPEYRDEVGPNYGLPGIIVTCENGELHLRATPYYSGMEQAIEFEIPLNEDDKLVIFEPNEDLNYFSNIFSTESVDFMYHYICALSDLMFEDSSLSYRQLEGTLTS